MALQLSELARRLGLEIQGEDKPIHGCNTLDRAGPGEISFFSHPRHVERLETTRAGAVVVEPHYAHKHSSCLLSTHPYRDFARIMHLFPPSEESALGISELAYVHPQASLGEGVSIHPFVHIGARSVICSGTVIHANCYIAEDCHIGYDCRLSPQVTLMPRTQLGDRVILNPGVQLGGDGFGFTHTEQGMEKVPQHGSVVVERDVEIGANSTVDRATLGETRIGEGTKIDNQVQVGHNVHIGRHCILVAQVGIAGSSTLGDKVVLAGQVGVGEHVEIGSGCRVGAKAGINRDLKSGSEMSGYPPVEHKKFLRMASLQQRLPEIYNRLKRLEAECEQLRAELESKEKSNEPRE